MPDNVRPPRNPKAADEPTLGVRAVMSAVKRVAKEKGLPSHRVLYKENSAGEHVVALIFAKR